jgi:hypothetical protein
MTTFIRPTLIFHADWGSKPSKRWCATATLGTDGRYTASAPTPVGDLNSLLKGLKAEVGETGSRYVLRTATYAKNIGHF